MSTPETHRFVVLSTAHVTAATARLLNDTRAEDWPCAGGPYGNYGWFVYAHEENLQVGARAIPDDLFGIMQWARKLRFKYILLDCDADTVDGLATYDW
ncbi:hypothetical protein ATER59S_00342 [Aquamicrobium terrae]